MSFAETSTLIARMQANNAMTADELLTLRRAFGKDMDIDTQEADALFALNTMETLPEGWVDYFSLVLGTYVTERSLPAGYVDDATAQWLITHIDHDGVVETETELRLLLSVMKTAKSPGERLEAYALKQVREAVMTGKGRVGINMLTPGVIGQAEVQLLRTIFYAMGGDGGVGITRMEAEQIFALNELTSGKDNHPSWQRFFVGAIANHLMMIAAPEMDNRQTALAREAWLEAPSPGLMSGFAKLTPKAILNAFRDVFGLKSEDLTSGYSVLDETKTRAAEKITAGEAQWLTKLLMADGQIDANERALLDFIREDCPDIDAQLRPLLDAV